ncbi:MAG: alkaline phosphatase D family protein [Anaerolineae bacterium]|nr:alkaline phosphatase D family protein [Anaerolineae bacterium]NUQ07306.1 alkaline phosphatase D family protein [Anaerolineae bacterium]
MTDFDSKPFSYSLLWERIEQEALLRFTRAISRRDFLKALGASAAVGTFARLSPARPVLSARSLNARAQSAAQAFAPSLPNGIAAGDVTQTGAVLWARSTIPGTVVFEIAEDDAFSVGLRTLTAEAVDPTLPVKVDAADLAAGTRYHYRVTTTAGDSLAGRFSTPAEVGAARRGLRFGVSGDWRGELRPYVAIANALDADLDFFIQHGDTIYADFPSLDFPGSQARAVADYRIKHGEVYSERYGLNYWAALRASTAVFATIDDHEVANDFAGGAPTQSDPRFAGDPAARINQTALYRSGLQAFQEYNPIRAVTYSGTNDDRMEDRPKLYRASTFGSDAAVFVLDTRSFRDDNFDSISPIDGLNPLRAIPYRRQFFEPGRTLVGQTQLDDLKRDLLAAQSAGVTWKFILIPEPMQNMGVFGGNDRWEGAALERADLLRFTEERGIRNVVFVSADVHTTFINNITYQAEAGGENIPTGAFEISTGSVAFYPPTGQALVEGAMDFGLLGGEAAEAYRAADIRGKDEVLESLFNTFVLTLQGYDTLGLDAERVRVVSVEGTNVVGHTFGWTLFEIAPETGRLTITTYGVPAYSFERLQEIPDAVLALEPEVRSRLVIDPQG